MNDFAGSPLRLAHQMGLEMQDYDPASVSRRIAPTYTAFVKWDARPGNAVVSNDKIVWFDWEHCGAGSVEDDLVWLLADEWSPDLPDAEKFALAHTSRESDMSQDEIASRFYIKAVLHRAIRLGLIFRRKGDGSWWNPVESLVHDRVGVSKAHVKRVCLKALRWVEHTSEMKSAASLFSEVYEKTDRDG